MDVQYLQLKGGNAIIFVSCVIGQLPINYKVPRTGKSYDGIGVPAVLCLHNFDSLLSTTLPDLQSGDLTVFYIQAILLFVRATCLIMHTRLFQF